MTQCKSCGAFMSEAAAGASIFALSFLPVREHTLDRKQTTNIAERIGPLCPNCHDRCKDLADTEAK